MPRQRASARVWHYYHQQLWCFFSLFVVLYVYILYYADSRPFINPSSHRTSAALDAQLMRNHSSWFGGGTCIALGYAEYCESVDVDFIVPDLQGYRALRLLLTGPQELAAITKAGAIPLQPLREMRADQYGIRTMVQIDGLPIKLEVV